MPLFRALLYPPRSAVPERYEFEAENRQAAKREANEERKRRGKGWTCGGVVELNRVMEGKETEANNGKETI